MDSLKNKIKELNDIIIVNNLSIDNLKQTSIIEIKEIKKETINDIANIKKDNVAINKTLKKLNAMNDTITSMFEEPEEPETDEE